MPTYTEWLRLVAENALDDFQKEVRHAPILRGLGVNRYYAVIAGGRPWGPNHGQDKPTVEFRTEVVLGSRLCADSGPPTDYQELAEQATRMAFATHVTGLDSDQLVLARNTWLWRYEWGHPSSTASAQLRPEGSNIALIMAVAGGRSEQNGHGAARLRSLVLKWASPGHMTSQAAGMGASVSG